MDQNWRDSDEGTLDSGSNTAEHKAGLTRRKFVLALGTGTAAAIVGYLQIPRSYGSTAAGGPQLTIKPTRPRLKSGISILKKGSMTNISGPVESKGPLCAVNNMGAHIVGLLDGRYSVEEISESLAARFDVPRTEMMDANVAQFIAQLGMLGFLAEPFYAILYERTEG